MAYLLHQGTDYPHAVLQGLLGIWPLAIWYPKKVFPCHKCLDLRAVLQGLLGIWPLAIWYQKKVFPCPKCLDPLELYIKEVLVEYSRTRPRSVYKPILLLARKRVSMHVPGPALRLLPRESPTSHSPATSPINITETSLADCPNPKPMDLFRNQGFRTVPSINRMSRFKCMDCQLQINLT